MVILSIAFGFELIKKSCHRIETINYFLQLIGNYDICDVEFATLIYFYGPAFFLTNVTSRYSHVNGAESDQATLRVTDH